MAVPNTTTFNLQDVVDEVIPTTDDLVDCFNDAAGTFDPAYSGYPANSLLRFGNYSEAASGNFLISTGRNDFGALAMNTRTDYAGAIQYPSITGIEDISASAYSLNMLHDTGILRTCGYNIAGQMGMGNETDYLGIIQTTALSNIKEIPHSTTGGYQHFIIHNDGTVSAYGPNNYGQLGVGNLTDYNGAIVTTPFTNVKQTASGANYSLILFNDGTVKSVGLNTNGQLGMGNTTNYGAAVQTTPFTNVKKVIAGAGSTYILFNDNTMKSVGVNSTGQLGMGNTTNYGSVIKTPPFTNIKDIQDGYESCYILFNDNTMKSFGRDSDGQLGGGSINAGSGGSIVTPAITNIRDIYVGGLHAAAVQNDGTLVTFGRNSHGQLLMGDISSKGGVLQYPNLVYNNIITMALQSFGTIVLAD